MRPTSGIAAGAESAGQLVADAHTGGGIGEEERLRVRIDRNKFHPLNSFGDHAVDRVGTAAADADDLDTGE